MTSKLRTLFSKAAIKALEKDAAKTSERHRASCLACLYDPISDADQRITAAVETGLDTIAARRGFNRHVCRSQARLLERT